MEKDLRLKLEKMRAKFKKVKKEAVDALQISLENSDRIRQLEETVQMSNGNNSTTTYQQEKFAKLENQVTESIDKIGSLEERIKKIESPRHSVVTKKMSKIMKLKEISKQFLATISVHGLPKISQAEKNIEQSFWILAIVALVSFGLYGIVVHIEDFQKFEVITNAQIVTDVTFPAVTICTSGQYKKNSYNNSMLVKSETTTEIDNSLMANFIGFTWTEYRGYSLKLTHFDFFKIAKWQGMCLRFNDAMDFDKKHYNPTVPYKFKLEMFASYVENVSDSEYTEYIYSDSYAVYINDNFLNSYLNVEPHILKNTAKHTVNFQKTITERQLGEPYNRCDGSLEKTYRQMNCIEICMNREVRQNYNCSRPSYYATDDLSNCDFFWYLYWHGYWHDSEMRDYKRRFLADCSNECPKECDSEIYSVLSTTTPRIGVTEFRVILNDRSSLEITQIPKMNGFNLLANFGGTLNLFIGLTFISFIEILQFICGIFYVVLIF